MSNKQLSVFILLLTLSFTAVSGCGGRSSVRAVQTEAAAPTNPAIPSASAPTIAPPTLAPSPTSPPPTEPATATRAPATATAAATAVPTERSAAEEIEVRLGLHAPEATGVKKYVVILADFPDVERKIPVQKQSERMVGFVEKYFSAASYGLLDMQGEMTKRYMLPDPVGKYKISPHNLEVDRSRVLKLVTDAVNAADADVQFGEDLMVMIALGATPAEYGMMGYSAVPGMLEFKSDDPIQTESGEVIRNAVVFCENAHLGTFIHDTLHMLGGVVDDQRMTPCLYDHDLQAKVNAPEDWAEILINMGYWDPLSSHFPYDRELPPAGLSSWTKLRLGWIDPAKIALVNPGETKTIRLDPLESNDPETLVIKIPLDASRYYLIENRQPVGADANLPASGVLILYADDSVDECRHGRTPVKIMDANPEAPYLNDAAYEIGKNQVFIDLENGLAVVLLKKNGLIYEVMVTTPDQVEPE